MFLTLYIILNIKPFKTICKFVQTYSIHQNARISPSLVDNGVRRIFASNKECLNVLVQ